MADNPFGDPLKKATEDLERRARSGPELPEWEAPAPTGRTEPPARGGAPSLSDPDYQVPAGDLMPPQEMQPVFIDAARRHGVPVNVLAAIAQQESGYNPMAVGEPTEWGRAKGMMQYLDSTADGVGINPFDPQQAIDGAARQLKERLDQGYSMDEAVMEHFAGPDRNLWGEKTSAYGREVLGKAVRIAEQWGGQMQRQPEAPREQAADGRRAPSPLTPENQERYEQGMPMVESTTNDMLAAATQKAEEYDGFLSATGKALGNVPERFLQSVGGLVQLAGEDMAAGRERDIEIRARRMGISPGDYKLIAWAGENDLLEEPESQDMDQSETLAYIKRNIAQALEPEQLEQLYSAGIVNPDEIAQYGEELRRSQEETMEPVNAEPGSMAYYGSAAIGSFAEMTPMLLATVLTRNPNVGMGIMAGQVGGQSYGEGRDEGLSPDEAQLYATLQAAAEAIPEGMVLERLLRPGKGVFGKVFQGAVAEGAQEVVTAALQAGIDKGMISPDMTWGEARQRIVDGGIIGALTGGAMGGTVAGADAIGRRVGRGQARKEAESNLERAEPAVPSEQVAADSLSPSQEPVPDPAAGPAPVPQEPAGPIQSAVRTAQQMTAAAAQPDEQVTVQTPAGPIGGVVQSFEENAQGGFTLRMMDENGQLREFTENDASAVIGADGVPIIEAETEAEPQQEQQAVPEDRAFDDPIDDSELDAILDSAIAGGGAGRIDETGARIEDEAAPAGQAAPEPAPDPDQVPGRSLDDLEALSTPDLRKELKAVKARIKDQGDNPELDSLRRGIERTINGRNRQAETPATEAETAAPAAAPDAETPAAAPAQLPEGYQGRRDGSPFKTETVARNAIKNRDLQGYEAVEVDGGWALAPASAEQGRTPPGTVPATGEVASWVIRDKESGEVVMETFDKAKVDALNTRRYEAVPIQEYLGSLNRQKQPAGPKPAQQKNQRPTPAQARKQRQERAKEDARKVIGAKEGDTIRPSEDVGYASAGASYKVDRIDGDGTVTVQNTETGGRTTLSRSELTAARRRGVTFDPVESKSGVTEAAQQEAAPEPSGRAQEQAPPAGRREPSPETIQQRQTFADQNALVGENTPEARSSLQAIFDNPNSVRLSGTLYGGVDASGNRKPTWRPAGKGFSARQYIQNGSAIQEIQSPSGAIATRKMDQNGVTTGSLEADATLDDFLSGAAFQQFEQFFDSDQSTLAAPQDEQGRNERSVPSANTLVTEDRAAELRKRLKAKLNQLNAGIDPEILAIGAELAVFHVERGARRFAAFARAMAEDLGTSIEDIRPYLRGWYNGSRDMMEDMGADIEGMDGSSSVRAQLRTLTDEAGAGAEGDTVTVTVGDERIPARFEVVEASDLEATMGKAANQYRDRSRAGSEMQVSSIANNLDFDQLGRSPVMDYGSPTLAQDGTVIGGNGRLAAINMAYDRGSADGYRQGLQDNAGDFGINPEAVAGMQRPVLVRRFTQEVDVNRLAVASNEGGGLRMSALEQAKVDAERMGDMSDFTPGENGEIVTSGNMRFIRRFIGEMPVNQQAAFTDADGNLSQEGIQRVRNAVLYRAYGDSPVLSRLVESADPGLRNVSNALVLSAPTVAEVRAGIAAGNYRDLDIMDDLIAAVEAMNRLRQERQSVSDYLDQMGLFGEGMSETAADLLRFIDENARRAKAIAGMIEDHYRGIRALGSPDQGDIFGSEGPDRQEVLSDAIERNRRTEGPQSGDLFGADPATRQSGGQQPGNAEAGAGDTGQASPEEGLGDTDATGSRAGVERDRGQRAAGAPADEAVVQPEPEADGPVAGRASGPAESGRAPGRGDQRVPADGAAARGERGNQPVHQQDGQFQPAPGAARGAERAGSGGDRGARPPVEQKRAADIARSAPTPGAGDLSSRLKAQQEAGTVPTAWGESSNIDQALPLLLPAQRGDVLKAEQRFQSGGLGMLFTNGTGTGKTATGLGIAKRFHNSGQTNIAVVVPTDKIASDWVKFSDMLGIPLKQLTGTQDNGGSGPIITTYANFGQNPTLADRDWDLIIPDESHYLSSSESGDSTRALDMLRALTGHHAGFNTYMENRHRDLYSRVQAANQARSAANANQDISEAEYSRREREAADLNTEWRRLLDQHRPEWESRWASQQGLAKATFLSATPFPYVKNVEYAEGFLFNFVPPAEQFNQDGRGRGYNEGGAREQFYMANFGYRMRYNKLTQPEAGVNAAVMEQQFNQRLQDEGALSGRRLEVDHDYSRRFVMVEDAVGSKIDDGLRWLREEGDGRYLPLYDYVRKKFDYLQRQYLLEAIKAKHAIPRIKQQLAMGRKVVVFHDYNKGGGFHPFKLPRRPNVNVTIRTTTDDGNLGSTEVPWDKLVQGFENNRPDLVNMDMGGLNSPIATMRQEFPDALFFNGTIPKGERKRNADLFNDDNSGSNLLVVQSDAGREGVSLHDTTGKHQRSLLNLGMPSKPVAAIQIEGRTYRTGQASDAIFEYMTTGTAWEAAAFGSKIAERASTAENLALGAEARGLRQAFIDAYQDAEYFEPSEADGTGGKDYDRQMGVGSSLTPFQRAKTFYYAQQKNTKRRGAREGADYYATPEPVGFKMVEWAGIKPNDRVLEPSAGHGAIARFVPEDAALTMVEPSYDLSQRAALARGDARIVNDQFEGLALTNKYDAIVMNPPYGTGGKTSTEHLAKAARHLRNGGRIVALLPRGPSATKRLDDFLASEEAANLYTVARVDMPRATFQRAGTQVSTQVLVLERQDNPADAAQIQQRNVDLDSAETVEELFDRLEDVSLRDRVPPSDPEPAAQPELVEHVTKKNKTLRGVIRTDLTKSQAQQVDPFTFRKSTDDGESGYFIREKHLDELAEQFPMGDESLSLDESITDADMRELADRMERDLGLEQLFLSYRPSSNTIHLDNMIVPRSQQKQGIGSQVMERLTDFADQSGARVALSPGLQDNRHGTTSRARLVRFYKRFGFVENKGRNKDFTLKESMYRAPQKRNNETSRVTDSEAFRNWFGDSKVVDENGDPLVVYHGTIGDFSEFSMKEYGTNFTGDYGIGFYFTQDPKIASGYADSADFIAGHKSGEFGGANVMPVYLKMENPLIVKKSFGTGDLWKKVPGAKTRQELTDGLISQGYDGVIVDGGRAGYRYISEAVVFNPNQIKSATGNRGTFDPADPDIRASISDQAPSAADIVQSRRSVIQQMRAGPAGPMVDALMEADALSVVYDVPPRIRQRIGPRARVQGFNSQGKITLVSKNLNPTRINAVLLHEAFHAGAPTLLGDRRWGNLMDQMGRMMKSAERRRAAGEVKDGNFWDSALRRVENARAKDPRLTEEKAREEFAAYAIEHYESAPSGIRKWIDSLVGAIKDFVQRKFGVQLGKITPAQLRSLSLAALRSRIGGNVNTASPVSQAVTARRNELVADAPNGTDPDVLMSMAEDSVAVDEALGYDRRNRFEVPPETRGDRLQRIFQDRFNRMKTVQKALAAQNGTLTEAGDVYMAEERYHGRSTARLEDFTDNEVAPFIEAVAEADVTLDEVAEYAYAKHAPERNAYAASINERFENGNGSGMTDQEAKDVLDAFEASGKTEALDRLHRQLLAISQGTRRMLVAEGLETADRVQGWEEMFSNYIPLKGFENVNEYGQEAPRQGTGSRGFSVTGKESKAITGRRSRASEIIENIVGQRERAIVRAEKNRVAKSLMRLVLDNPDQSLWAVNEVQRKPVVRLGDRTALEDIFSEQPAHAPRQKGRRVEYVPIRSRYDDNVVVAKVKGREVLITIKDPVLAEQLKMANATELPPGFKQLNGVNRVLARLWTSLNPVFSYVNYMRDIQTAYINALGETDAKVAMATMKRSGPFGWSMRAIKQGMQGKDTEGAKWYNRYRQAGGKTGFYSFNQLEDQQKKLQKLLETATGDRSKAMAAGRAVVDFVEDVNAIVENAVRLSAFRASIESGMSDARAASFAKNLTVNFNRRGEWTHFFGSLYLFFNPAVQGTVRIGQALRSPKVQGLVAGLTVANFALGLLGRAIGGEDEDGEYFYDKIPQSVRRRNMVIMNPFSEEGGYFKIPMPYGYSFFASIGDAAYNKMVVGQSNGKVAAEVATAFGMSFNPVGNGTPTVFAPAIDIAVNENYFGDPIYPEPMPYEPPTPDSTKYWPSMEGTFLQKVTGFANEATGGNEVRPGMIDVSPEVVEHVFRSFTGGLGTAANDIIKVLTDPEQDVTRFPFVKQMYGTPFKGRNVNQFYENLVEAELADAEAELYRGQSPEEYEELLRTEGWKVAMEGKGQRLRKRLAKERRRIDKIQASTMPDAEKREAVKQVREQMDQRTIQFNREWNRAKKAADQ